jgi:hypothetical protein
VLAPKPFNHQDGSNLGLNVPMLDAMNRFLGESDLMGKLILAQAQDGPCGTQLGGKRRPLNTHNTIELQSARFV